MILSVVKNVHMPPFERYGVAIDKWRGAERLEQVIVRVLHPDHNALEVVPTGDSGDFDADRAPAVGKANHVAGLNLIRHTLGSAPLVNASAFARVEIRMLHLPS